MQHIERDDGLDSLLELNGCTYETDRGYWYKFEVIQVEPTAARPHGLRYCFTLHDQYNKRVLGFDNAHAVYAKEGGKYSATLRVYDHVHRDSKDKGTPYTFSTPGQLMEDFFKTVDNYLKKIGY